MKKALIGGLLVAGLIGLAGCQSSKSSGNMGTVSGQKTECCSKDKAAGECKDKAAGNMGAVSTKSECCSSKASGNMGAVSTKSECSTTKTTCTAEKKVN